METEVLQAVLREILDELKEVKQQLSDIKKALDELKIITNSCEHKLEDINQQSNKVDMQPVIDSIEEAINSIEHRFEAQPKSIVRQFRVLLFPEYGASEYYKIVFGRLLFWITILIAATYLFLLGKSFIEAYSFASYNDAATSKYKRAWIDLYNVSKRSVRLRMDSVWRKS